MDELLQQLKAYWEVILLILLGLAKGLLSRQIEKRPETEKSESHLPTIHESQDRCSEAAIRALAKDLRHLPRGEAWRHLRDHYHGNLCADFLDLGRFEEIVVETWGRYGAEDEMQS